MEMSIGWTGIVILIAVCTIWKTCLTKGQECSLEDTVGQRIGGENLTASPFGGYLMKDYVIDCCGGLTAWEYYGMAPIGLIQLQVWKPLDPVNNVYQLRGKRDVFSFGVSMKSVALGELSIAVRPGDVIGWRTTSAAIIGYVTGDEENGQNFFQPNMAGVLPGDNFTFSSEPLLNKTYSIFGHLEGASPPTFENLPTTIVLQNYSSGDVIFSAFVKSQFVAVFETLEFQLIDSYHVQYITIDKETGDITVINKLESGNYTVGIEVLHPCGVSSQSVLDINVPEDALFVAVSSHFSSVTPQTAVTYTSFDSVISPYSTATDVVSTAVIIMSENPDGSPPDICSTSLLDSENTLHTLASELSVTVAITTSVSSQNSLFTESGSEMTNAFMSSVAGFLSVMDDAKTSVDSLFMSTYSILSASLLNSTNVNNTGQLTATEDMSSQTPSALQSHDSAVLFSVNDSVTPSSHMLLKSTYLAASMNFDTTTSSVTPPLKNGMTSSVDFQAASFDLSSSELLLTSEKLLSSPSVASSALNIISTTMASDKETTGDFSTSNVLSYLEPTEVTASVGIQTTLQTILNTETETVEYSYFKTSFSSIPDSLTTSVAKLVSESFNSIPIQEVLSVSTLPFVTTVSEVPESATFSSSSSSSSDDQIRLFTIIGAVGAVGIAAFICTTVFLVRKGIARQVNVDAQNSESVSTDGGHVIRNKIHAPDPEYSKLTNIDRQGKHYINYKRSARQVNMDTQNNESVSTDGRHVIRNKIHASDPEYSKLSNVDRQRKHYMNYKRMTQPTHVDTKNTMDTMFVDMN